MTRLAFISELCESQLIRNKHLYKDYSAKDVSELIFLYFISLELLRNDFENANFAIEYAKHSLMWSNFDYFRTNGNDLYALIYILFGKNNENDLKTLEDQKSSLLFLEKIYFDIPKAKLYLNNIKNNDKSSSQDRQFLFKLESMLQIQNAAYKSLRRLVCNWSDCSHEEQQLAMTRLLMAFRTRAKRSELLAPLLKMAKKNNLELKHFKNPEEKDNHNKLTLGVAAGISAAILAKSIKNLLHSVDTPKKLPENASGGATGAGAIAATPSVLGQSPIRRPEIKSKKSKKNNKQSIFA